MIVIRMQAGKSFSFSSRLFLRPDSGQHGMCTYDGDQDSHKRSRIQSLCSIPPVVSARDDTEATLCFPKMLAVGPCTRSEAARIMRLTASGCLYLGLR